MDHSTNLSSPFTAILSIPRAFAALEHRTKEQNVSAFLTPRNRHAVELRENLDMESVRKLEDHYGRFGGLIEPSYPRHRLQLYSARLSVLLSAELLVVISRNRQIPRRSV